MHHLEDQIDREQFSIFALVPHQNYSNSRQRGVNKKAKKPLSPF